jgi:hypothetical protein
LALVELEQQIQQFRELMVRMAVILFLAQLHLMAAVAAAEIK